MAKRPNKLTKSTLPYEKIDGISDFFAPLVVEFIRKFSEDADFSNSLLKEYSVSHRLKKITDSFHGHFDELFLNENGGISGKDICTAINMSVAELKLIFMSEIDRIIRENEHSEKEDKELMKMIKEEERNKKRERQKGLEELFAPLTLNEIESLLIPELIESFGELIKGTRDIDNKLDLENMDADQLTHELANSEFPSFLSKLRSLEPLFVRSVFRYMEKKKLLYEGHKNSYKDEYYLPNATRVIEKYMDILYIKFHEPHEHSATGYLIRISFMAWISKVYYYFLLRMVPQNGGIFKSVPYVMDETTIDGITLVFSDERDEYIDYFNELSEVFKDKQYFENSFNSKYIAYKYVSTLLMKNINNSRLSGVDSI